MKLSGSEWEGEAGWGAGSWAGAAGEIVSGGCLLDRSGGAGEGEGWGGKVLGGIRLPRKLIMGARARRRRVGCMVRVRVMGNG